MIKKIKFGHAICKLLEEVYTISFQYIIYYHSKNEETRWFYIKLIIKILEKSMTGQDSEILYKLKKRNRFKFSR